MARIGGFEYFPPLLLVAWIPTMVLIWRFSARLEGGESPMDGDYSSSSAAGNSHSCGGDDHVFLYSVIRKSGSRL
jgi:hypothetical protein